MKLHGAAFSTPLGHLAATANDQGLTYVGFDLDVLVDARQNTGHPGLEALQGWLRAYLHKQFTGLPQLELAPLGTDFEQAVWKALRAIGPGRTAAYGDIARQVGKPSAARAVGAAVGRYPWIMVVPYHRVVGSKGHLTGFSAGIQRKVWLLRHEGTLLL